MWDGEGEKICECISAQKDATGGTLLKNIDDMHIEKTVKVTFETQEEVRMLKTIFDYAYHRLSQHPECGIKGMVDIKKLNVMRALL